MKSASPRFPRLALALSFAGLSLMPQAGGLEQALIKADKAMQEAADYLTATRDRAYSAGRGSKPPLTDAEKQDLAETDALLDSRLFRNVVARSERLLGEYYNFRTNLVDYEVIEGHTDKALSLLQRANRSALLPQFVKMLKDDPKLASLMDVPGTKPTLKAMHLPAKMGSKSAIGSPYADNLSDAEKVAGLSLYWSQARSSFVHFDHVPELDWDAAYLEFLPKVLATKSTQAYYQVLMQFAPLLKDGHSNIYPPQELQEQFYSRPPIRTALIENKVLVTGVQSPTVRKQIKTGEEIVAVDGVPVRRYAKEFVAPFVSSSTPQDANVRQYNYQLLSGDAKKPIKLTLRKADGKQHIETIARDGYTDVEPRQYFEFTMLPGNIAYLSLDSFAGEQAVHAFKAHQLELMRANGLILDVRRNGGGSTKPGYAILSQLTDEPIPASASWVRSDSGWEQTRGDIMTWRPLGEYASEQPSQAEIFTGPVMILAGAQSFSAAEDFLVAFDTLKRGKIIGEPSGGSTGQPLLLSLPGGGIGRICVKRDTYADGREFVGIGVQPDIAVAPTIADIRAGRDPVLERAITEVKASIKTTAR